MISSSLILAVSCSFFLFLLPAEGRCLWAYGSMDNTGLVSLATFCLLNGLVFSTDGMQRGMSLRMTMMTDMNPAPTSFWQLFYLCFLGICSTGPLSPGG